MESEYRISEEIIGIIGKKTTFYEDFRFEPASDASIYRGKDAPDSWAATPKRDSTYWEKMRIEPLSKEEAGIYEMVARLKDTPFFQAVLTSIKLATSGYFSSGPVDIGSVLSFVSFNQVEGWRFKFGAKTNGQFHDRIHLQGYLAYGLRDDRLKYSGSIKYALEDQYRPFPRQYIGFTAERDNRFPGQFTRRVARDNLFLSIRTAPAEKMFSYDLYRMQYYRRFGNDLSLDFKADRKSERAAGNFNFSFLNREADQTAFLDKVVSTETSLALQYAPNAQYFEGAHVRFPLPNRYPILDLTYAKGWENVLNGDYDYHRLQLEVTKRFYIAALGYGDAKVRAGKIWGSQLPYVLLVIPPSNQTFIFQTQAFNATRFLEFITDEYVGLHYDHHFNGYLLNKIPLLRKLKLRSTAGVKILYGGLSEENDPTSDPALVQFPTNEQGAPETFALRDDPYLEVNVGIENIFKLFRIVYVRRLSYLDHPDIPSLFGIDGSGIRVGMGLKF